MHVRLIATFILAAVALGALRAPAWSQERRPTKEEREKRKAELRELQKNVRREVKQIDFEKTLAAIPALVAREKEYMALVKTFVDTATGGQGDVKKLLQQGRTLKLAHLISVIQSETGSSKKAATETLAAILSTISASLKKNQKIQLVGFGSFEVVKRRARKGRNPATGASIRIKASKGLRFKAGSKLKGGL